MAETKNRLFGSGAQDTGNPVLDSLVNIVASGLIIQTTSVTDHDVESIRKLHTLLLELSTKEPGGLRKRKLGGRLVVAGPATEE